MKDALIKINAYQNLVREVDSIRCEKFSHEDSSQLNLLLDLWIELKAETETRPESIKNRKWRELGFQGDDPSTDFRGMGMLALNCLKYIFKNYTIVLLKIYNFFLKFFSHKT